MKNTETGKEHQIKLFKVIESKLPANVDMIDTIAGLLGFEQDAVYRRKRGDKLMSFEEVHSLCREYNISINELIYVYNNKGQIICDYLNNPDNYVAATQLVMASIGETLKSEVEILLSAVDIPVFHIVSDKELILFKIFSWNKRYRDNGDSYIGNFEAFVKDMESVESLNIIHEKIVKNYRLIPSSEIWTETTVDAYLKLLNYHFDLGHFNDKKYPLLICKQLLNLMNRLQDWAAKGVKDAEKAQFKFYVNEIDTVNTFVLFKSPKNAQYFTRLSSINGLSISDKRFCKEAEAWFHSSTQRATLLSEASEKERYKFFNTQKQKIEALRKKIECSIGK